MTCALGEPGPVTPGPVGDDGDGRLWETTVARHHPPGRARPPGGQVRHWIRPERRGPGPGGVHLREARRGRHGDGPDAGDG